MHEILLLAFRYLRGMWRYRWIALGVAWLVAVAGWAYVSKMPDEYRASARVFVDANSVLRPLLRGLTIEPDLIQRVSLMSRMLLSRPNLEKIARMSDLDLTVQDARQKEALINDLSDGIRIHGDRSNSSLYKLSFEHQDPERAKRVVQSLVSVFIEEALVADQADTSTAHDFLDQEIADYEARLQKSEKDLADFKREYAGLMSGDTSGYYSRLEEAKAGLKNANLSLREAIWMRDELAQQIETEDQAAASEPDLMSFQQFEDPRIIEMQSKLDDLLLRFTDRHPDVVQLRRLIDELRKEQRARQAELARSQPAASVSAGTVYGSLRVALSQADAQVASLKARVEDYSKRVDMLTDKINSIPTIEAKLKQLTRNYSTIASQHSALLTRRESARLSTQVEKTAEGVKFRVVDPPFVPLKPSAPNRIVLAAMALVVAIGAGLATALGLDLLKPVFDDRQVLYRELGLPVFGSVALVQTRAQRRRDRLMLIPLAAGTASLVVVFILVASGLPRALMGA